MIGAIAGDIVGSVFEHLPTKRDDFKLFHLLSRFTDDTVLTAAVAVAIMGTGDYAASMRDFALRYPDRGYGGRFRKWVNHPHPYQSFGNGAAMRVSPIGFAFDDERTVLAEAERSAACSHNHPEGIKGAQATALAIYRARSGATKTEIKQELEERFHYNLSRKLADFQPMYSFDVTCQGSVPEAIICFLEAVSYEDSIRKAVSLGGDADTQACIAGGIAEAFHGGVPAAIAQKARHRLRPELVDIVDRFYQAYVIT